MYYTKIVLRTDYTKKDGTSPVRLRLTIGGQVNYYTLPITVNKNDWNFKVMSYDN